MLLFCCGCAVLNRTCDALVPRRRLVFGAFDGWAAREGAFRYTPSEWRVGTKGMSEPEARPSRQCCLDGRLALRGALDNCGLGSL